MGAGAIALAEWGVSSNPGMGVLSGWGWLPGALVAPHYNGPERVEALRAALVDHPDKYGLGIPDDTALALGPDGEVQQWGGGQVSVTLGSRFRPEG
jgi:cyanophycinase-like exopeptidase